MDHTFMQKAIEDAKKTKHHFGAVVVKNNEIIGKGVKRPLGDPRFHAETHAIMEACEKLKTKKLNNCTLYSTCEPCPMCFYMAWITNISKIVYGATIKDAVKAGTLQIKVSNKFLNKKSGNKIKIIGNFMREECLKLLPNEQ